MVGLCARSAIPRSLFMQALILASSVALAVNQPAQPPEKQSVASPTIQAEVSKPQVNDPIKTAGLLEWLGLGSSDRYTIQRRTVIDRPYRA